MAMREAELFSGCGFDFAGLSNVSEEVEANVSGEGLLVFL
jgi:hypothetical protein